MRAIKQVLTERYYSWQDAEKLAKEDPEFDFSGNGPLWTPGDYLEDVSEENMEFESEAEEVDATLEPGMEQVPIPVDQEAANPDQRPSTGI